MSTHRFYHVDRGNSLSSGQVLSLNREGLSRFGETYRDVIHDKPLDSMSYETQREYLLERVRQDPKFALYTSRLSAFFGANTLEDARRFATTLNPKPIARIPIFEVFSSKFWTLDMNWLDYASDHDQRMKYYIEYWHAAISNHNPPTGERKPPLLEVLMSFPVEVGEVVEWI